MSVSRVSVLWLTLSGGGSCLGPVGQVSVNGKMKSMGFFADEVEAARAYDR